MKPVDKVRQLLAKLDLDATVLTRRANFAWLTGGGSSAIRETTDDGVATLVVNHQDVILLTSNIELQRIIAEQVPQLSVTPQEYPWYSDPNLVLSDLLAGQRVGSDNFRPGTLDLSKELSQLRSILEPEEVDRYRSFASQASSAIEEVCYRLRPGWSEREVYTAILEEATRRRIRPIVILVGGEERLFRYRHPLPTESKLGRYAMLVICGERFGLIANTTRFVHFGDLPRDLAEKHAMLAHISSALIAGTQAGRPYRDFFRELQNLYAQAGYPDEWRLHHQGGPTGYLPREFLVTPTTEGEMSSNQAFAWNPSIRGAKSEDTLVLTERGPELLTLTSDWPMLEVEVQDQLWLRPAVLARTD